MPRVRAWLTLGVLCAGAAALFGARHVALEPRLQAPRPKPPAAAAPPAESDSHPAAGAASPVVPRADDDRAHAFRVPTGDPPGLSCDAARTIVSQVRKNLAYAPDAVAPKAFAAAAGDWLDPYGLWSVAPDTPITSELERRSPEILAEIEGRASSCAGAREVGRALVPFVAELRRVFDKARAATRDVDAANAVSDEVFEGATVNRPARGLATLLGERVGAFEHALGQAAQPYALAARNRYFPELDEDGWARVLLAASVRAYVPLVDPHGAWAPLDEEASVYEVDLEARPPERLWDKSARTALGLRVDSGGAAPLEPGDVILSLGGVTTAGLPLEQLDQLNYAVADSRGPVTAIVLSAGGTTPRTVELDPSDDGAENGAEGSGAPGDDLVIERVPYGKGDALLVPIHDVRDDLGDALTRAILRERTREDRTVEGVVLDLRGNGGGSTDGAIDALGVFIAGAPLFPMRRRDGTLETDRAPEPPNVDRWDGPVATLVDAETASAAEMIAGALASYGRGPVVGTTTFGKGCAQEYLDDDAHFGVLRLTTLLYALPDGSPVQRVGLTPHVRFPFQPADDDDDPGEREATLAHTAPLWRGPDVRDRTVLAHAADGTWSVAWPFHEGNVGPCKEADVCRALRALGGGSPQAKRVWANKGR